MLVFVPDIWNVSVLTGDLKSAACNAGGCQSWLLRLLLPWFMRKLCLALATLRLLVLLLGAHGVAG